MIRRCYDLVIVWIFWHAPEFCNPPYRAADDKRRQPPGTGRINLATHRTGPTFAKYMMTGKNYHPWNHPTD